MTISQYLHMMLPGMVVAAVAFAALWVYRRRRLDKMGLESPVGREMVLLLFWVYCGAMFMVLMFPKDFDLLNVLAHGYDRDFFRPGEISVRFLKSLQYSQLLLWGNVLLFVPLGFAPALLWRERHWYGALLLALLVPGIVENWQLFIGRTFDVDDLVLNGAGVMLGWLVWTFLERPALHCEEK